MLCTSMQTAEYGSIKVSAPFPETYTQSSFGIKLSKEQLVSRCAKLHVWMGALLTSFHAYPKQTQELIQDFMGIEEDDPSEPENKIIMNMCVDHREDIGHSPI